MDECLAQIPTLEEKADQPGRTVACLLYEKREIKA